MSNKASLMLAIRESHTFCRLLYKSYRKQGCPPMIAIFDFQDTWYVETKDGSFSIQQVKADCIWDAKAQGCQQWLERFRVEEEK